MRYAYRLGKAMMLPVACLPVAGILLGIGYWLMAYGDGSHPFFAQLMLQAGSVLLNHMSLLFAMGVAAGLADEQDGTATLAAVAAWSLIQNVLTVRNVTILTGGRVDASAFYHIDNQMIGIFCGILGAYCNNTYRKERQNKGIWRVSVSGRRIVIIAAFFYAMICLDSFGSLAIFLSCVCLYRDFSSRHQSGRCRNLYVS